MKNVWNITGPKHYIDQMRGSKYFTKNLGNSLTKATDRGREMREGVFTDWYYKNYKSMLFKIGEIGPLHFFIDYYIKKDIVGFFLDGNENKHQYAAEWDQEYIDEVGIDSWLSKNLEEIDESTGVVASPEVVEVDGDSDNLLNNPGGASWKDIEAYMKKKKRNIL